MIENINKGAPRVPPGPGSLAKAFATIADEGHVDLSPDNLIRLIRGLTYTLWAAFDDASTASKAKVSELSAMDPLPIAQTMETLTLLTDLVKLGLSEDAAMGTAQ